ncbi:MAG: uncharacterized protein QG597_3499 [Actinomycetota bacterium]|nr:uncharacterized protein [Actinomycetota bacterium]
MRAVLDTNVVISALLNPTGAPARVVRAWTAGVFEYVASELLLAEVERAFAYSKIRTRIPPDDASRFVDLMRANCEIMADRPLEVAFACPDPRDEFLISLAHHARAFIVTGDGDLLSLTPGLPVVSPTAFLEIIGE